MTDRALEAVRRKFVSLLRVDPPFRVQRGRGAPVLDRWIADRFSHDEVQTLFRHEREYGEEAMAEWFAEALLEAGVASAPRVLAS